MRTLQLFLILSLLACTPPNPNKSYNKSKQQKITVIGTAIAMKHDAAILTDDNIRYYLDGIDEWDDKILGKKVKVTGKLVIKKYEIEKNTDTVVTLIPQQRLGTWRIIMKPKWSLAE